MKEEAVQTLNMRKMTEEGGHKPRHVNDLYLETANSFSSPPPRKRGPPSYNPMELNSANKEQAMKWIFPQSLQKGTQSANTLILFLQNPYQTSDLQNGKMTSLHHLGCSVLRRYSSNRKPIHIPWNTTQQRKRNEPLLYTTTWVDLKGMMLRGKSQYQKVTYVVYDSIYKHSQSGKVLGMENRLVVARGQRWWAAGRGV